MPSEELLEKEISILGDGLKTGWSKSTLLKISLVMKTGRAAGKRDEVADDLLKMLEECRTEEEANARMDELEVKYSEISSSPQAKTLATHSPAET